MLNIGTILQPTDFSTSSEDAFRLACLLARTLNARIFVLHAYPPPICHGEVVARQQPNGFHEILWADLERIRSPGICVEHMLEEGEPGATILCAARAIPCDLIVMGTRGRTGWRRLLMGSVAEKVVRSASCPVLTVRTAKDSSDPAHRDHRIGKIHAILLATDFSASSQYALELAFAFARDCGARLILLHVASPPPFVSYGEFEKVLHQSSGYRRELEERLRQCQKPDCNAEFRLQEGDPGDEIIHVAEETGCDLVVMGTHGRTGLGRLFLGSVAEKVLRRAPCPVLTVKTPLPLPAGIFQSTGTGRGG